jgi:hypothetical protein
VATIRLPRSLAILALGLFLLAGCGDKKSTKPEDPGPGPLMPDFALEDVNPNSATHGEIVSPRQFVGRVSCWYFGHAT